METHDATSPRRRRRMPKAIATGLGLLGLGAAAGGIASSTLTAGAATTSTTAAAGSSSTTAAPSSPTTPPSGSSTAAPPVAGLPLSGTVSAVGASDVTIGTSTGTTTYAVTSTSDIDKNGEATLSALSVGDAVTFSTVTTNGTTAIDKLHAGNEQLDMPAGHGPGGVMGLPLNGTVTAVGTSDVTIRTSAGTTTYAVTSTSDIDKNGEAALSALSVGDAVTFSTVTTNGTTAIDKLHAGNEQLDMPAGHGPGAIPPTAPGGSAASGTTSGA